MGREIMPFDNIWLVSPRSKMNQRRGVYLEGFKANFLRRRRNKTINYIPSGRNENLGGA